jgi:hypothetical protein
MAEHYELLCYSIAQVYGEQCIVPDVTYEADRFARRGKEYMPWSRCASSTFASFSNPL